MGSVFGMTEEDARRVATSLLSERYADFKAGDWILSGVEEYDTAWAFSYNTRVYVETREDGRICAGRQRRSGGPQVR